jgi:hypothetical protein
MIQTVQQCDDEELKELAALALRNAFWHDFSALVNKYVAASAGLDVERQESNMSDMASVYGRDLTEDTTNVVLNIHTVDIAPRLSTSHQTIVEALNHASAGEVHVQGKKVFDRRANGWYFVN